MAEAQKAGHCIKFDVLYYANGIDHNTIMEEIGQKEGELIRKHRPPLNHQIPKEENWRRYEQNNISKTITLAEILQ